MSKNKTYLVDSVKVDNKDSFASINSNIKGKALLAILDATHSGFVNGNFFFYQPDAMKESFSSWITPYKKPFLIHHRLSDQETGGAVDPIGRVIDARFIDDERGGFTQLDTKVMDEDAKTKIMDGRYSTVSTRVVPVDVVECTQCGSNILKDGFCGHPRGKVIEDEETGEKKLTYWLIGKTKAKEVSAVNAPADQSDRHYAGIVNWEFADSENPDLSNAPEIEEHPGIFVFDNQVVIPDLTVIERFKDSPNEDIIVNKSLWEQIEGNIDRYADMGGLVLIDRQNPKVIVETPTADKTKDDNSDDEYDPETAEWTDEDFIVLDWLVDELDKELKAQPKSRQLTNKVGDKGKIAHAHVASLNQAGNGHTDYVFGHSHRIVDNRIVDAISDGAEKAHSHKFEKQLKIPKEYLDTIEAHVTGFATQKNVLKHRHVMYGNEAKNGWTDYVAGHQHDVVSGRLMPATADGEEKGHSHRLGQIIDLRDQWLDEETWDVVDLPDAEMSEKAKKTAQKAGKKFCGPNDPRKGRKSFPAADCAHVRAGLRLLAKYKGPGKKSTIRACLKRQNSKLNCGVKASDEQAYALIELLSTVVKDK